MPERQTIETKDQLKLLVKEYPVEEPQAVVILVHGHGDHQDRYQHVAKAFNNKNFVFVTFDLRGHGKSEGSRGHVPEYHYFLEDLERVINLINDKYEVPICLYGHSMGGNIVLNYLIRSNDRIKAGIVTSPWLRLASKPSFIKMLLGQLVLKVYPKLTQHTRLNAHFLSHENGVVTAYQQDPLVHDEISSSLFFGMKDAGEYAIENASEVKVPVLLSHGEDDNITDYNSSKKLSDVENITFKAWPGMYHETHNEVDKHKVLEFYTSWLDEKINYSTV